MTYWTQYWKWQQVADCLEARKLLDRIYGTQLTKVAPGDVIWVLGFDDQAQRLVTIGSLIVHRVVDDPDEVYAEAQPGTTVQPLRVDLHPFLDQLQFESGRALDPERSLPMQLQTMRRLEAESARFLAKLWNESALAEPAVPTVQLDALPDGPLDGYALSLRRLEQHRLRSRLFGDRPTADCALCGRHLPVSLLVAAHIKPRAACSDAEKRDPTNIIAACLLGCDALFEQGWIQVRESVITEGHRPMLPGVAIETLVSLIGRRIACQDARSAESWASQRQSWNDTK